MRLAVEAVSSPPTVTSSFTLFSVKNRRLKLFSKSASVGLKRLICKKEPPWLKMPSAMGNVMSTMRGEGLKRPV